MMGAYRGDRDRDRDVEWGRREEPELIDRYEDMAKIILLGVRGD
jgi:hypothetical protein